MAAALVAGTVKAVTSTSQIVAGAYELSKKLLDLLKPPTLRLDSNEVHCLLCIQRQIESLLRPLEICVLCCRHRDSAARQSVALVEDTLKRIWQRIGILEQRSFRATGTNAQQKCVRESRRRFSYASSERSRSSFTMISPIDAAAAADESHNYGVTIDDQNRDDNIIRRDRTSAASSNTQLSDVSNTTILRWCMDELGIAVSQLTLTLTTLQLSSASFATEKVSVATALKAFKRLTKMTGQTGDVCLQGGSLFIIKNENNMKQLWSKCLLRISKSARTGSSIILEPLKENVFQIKDDDNFGTASAESEFMVLNCGSELKPISTNHPAIEEFPSCKNCFSIPSVRAIFPGEIALCMKLLKEDIANINSAFTKNNSDLSLCHNSCIIWSVSIDKNDISKSSTYNMNNNSSDPETYIWIENILKEISSKTIKFGFVLSKNERNPTSEILEKSAEIPALEFLYTARFNYLESSRLLGGNEQNNLINEDDLWSRVSDESLNELLANCFYFNNIPDYMSQT